MKAALVLAGSAMLLAMTLAPAVAPAQLAGDEALPSTQRGIGFAKDPSGARVTRVVKDSAAERSGVTEGMVITHIDGLPLRELTETQIARIFAGARERLELKIRGGGSLTVNDASASDSFGSALKVGHGDY